MYVVVIVISEILVVTNTKGILIIEQNVADSFDPVFVAHDKQYCKLDKKLDLQIFGFITSFDAEVTSCSTTPEDCWPSVRCLG